MDRRHFLTMASGGFIGITGCLDDDGESGENDEQGSATEMSDVGRDCPPAEISIAEAHDLLSDRSTRYEEPVYPEGEVGGEVTAIPGNGQGQIIIRDGTGLAIVHTTEEDSARVSIGDCLLVEGFMGSATYQGEDHEIYVGTDDEMLDYGLASVQIVDE